jgi:hypothetical protein
MEAALARVNAGLASRLRVLAVSVALAGGCSPPGIVEPRDDCFLGIEQYCSVYACPSYETSRVEVEQASARFCFVAQTGRCGALRFTRIGQGFGVTTRYFDALSVVAVHETSDAYAVGSACPNWKHYGRRLSCAEVVLEDFCRR